MTTMTATTTQVYELFVKATPEAIWEAITKPEFTERYFHGARISATADGYRSVGPDDAVWGDAAVTEFDPPHRFAWAVGDPGHPAATWRFTLMPDGAGTRLEQWYQMGPARSGLNIAIDAMPDKEAKIVFVRMREHESAMQHNLAEIKNRAERAG